MAYIGRTTDGFGVRQRFVFTPNAGTTSISGNDVNGATLTFSDSVYMDVFLNGVLLKAGTDYNTNTANTIAGLTATVANDEVTVLVYDIFTTADMVSATSGGTFSGNVTFNGNTTLAAASNSTATHTMGTDNKLLFRDTAISINSSADGQLDIDADTEVEITTTTVDLNGALDVSGATTTAAITASGVIKTDDTTDSTSTTTGSIQTDGGLGVAKDVVVGDDILLKSDSAAIQFGADSEITLTHSADAGLSLRTSASTGPVLNIGTTSTSVSDGGFIGGIMFDAGSSNTATARIQALASGTSEDGADISFECRDSGASFTEKFRIDGDGNVKVNEGNLIIGTSGKGIDFSATGDGSGGSSISELLDDYEEGTFTGTMFGSSGSAGSVAGNAQTFTYVKVGNMVMINGSPALSNVGSYSGDVRLSGLPFANGANHSFSIQMTWHNFDSRNDASGNLNIFGYAGQSYLQFSKPDTTYVQWSSVGTGYYGIGGVYPVFG